eukprot:8042199-Pyramimonas_sp.AAC.1
MFSKGNGAIVASWGSLGRPLGASWGLLDGVGGVSEAILSHLDRLGGYRSRRGAGKRAPGAPAPPWGHRPGPRPAPETQ